MKEAEAFAGALAECYGEELASVLLYGSAARGDYREGISDLNILVLLHRLDPELLRRGTAIARDWAARGNPPPLMFSLSEWRASADVFPIEYGEMRDANRLLYGADPFEGLEIDWEHLRLQCEHELKSKQIQLREQYMLLAGEEHGPGELLTRSFPTFLTLFRTGLRLAGQAAPREAAATIDAVAQQAGFDPAPFHEVHGVRSSGESFHPPADAGVVTGYLAAVARTTAWLDGLTAPPGAGPGAGG